MRQWMTNLVEASRAKRKAAQFKSGYNYAAGTLLSNGGITECKRDLLCECSSFIGAISPFDKGIVAALADWDDHMEGQHAG